MESFVKESQEQNNEAEKFEKANLSDLAYYSSLNSDVVPASASETLKYLKEKDNSEKMEVVGLPEILIIGEIDKGKDCPGAYLRNFYTVLFANDGEEGIFMIREKCPDLIISHTEIGHINGIRLCAQLKKDPKTTPVPVIILSKTPSLELKIKALEAGAEDCLTLPYDLPILKLRVKNLLRSPGFSKALAYTSTLPLEPNPQKEMYISVKDLFLDQVTDSIERNINNTNYGIDELGRDVGMSRTLLYRKLKACTGQSANEVIRATRIKKAAILLQKDQYSISEITHLVGFKDLQYFRDCFKKYYGTNPSDYIHNNRKSFLLKNMPCKQ